MFAILTSWIIITFVFFTFGNMLMSIYASVIKQKVQHSFIDTFMLGLCMTAAVVSIASILVPANTTLMIVLVAISSIYWLFRRSEFYDIIILYKTKLASISKLKLGIVSVAMLAIAIHATGGPIWVDSSFYHFQNIMWNELYHVVPGLANLEPRTGFNNNYFLLCSTFGLKPLFGQYIFGVHTLCLAYVVGWTTYRSLTSTNWAKIIIPPLLCLGFVMGYQYHISSPSTDTLPNLLILYLVIKILFDKDAIKENPLIYMAVPAFCITLKLSAFIVCLFGVYVLWLAAKKKEDKLQLLLITIVLLIVVPWCVRTVILSGYLIFPYPGIDIFNFDWKIPAEYAQEQKDVIHAFARADKMTMDEALSLSTSEWIKEWWHSGMFYYTPYVNRFFFILSLIAIPLTSILFFWQRKWDEYLELFIAWCIMFVGCVFWFFSAPDFRFGYGFILSLSLIPFYIMLDLIATKLKNKVENLDKIQLILTIFVVSLIALQAFRWSYYKRFPEQAYYQTLLYKPVPLEYTRSLKEKHFDMKIEFEQHQINGVMIYRPNIESHCYECQLPCSCDYTGGIEMRGATLQEGFRTKPGSTFLRSY